MPQLYNEPRSAAAKARANAEPMPPLPPLISTLLPPLSLKAEMSVMLESSAETATKLEAKPDRQVPAEPNAESPVSKQPAGGSKPLLAVPAFDERGVR